MTHLALLHCGRSVAEIYFHRAFCHLLNRWMDHKSQLILINNLLASSLFLLQFLVALLYIIVLPCVRLMIKEEKHTPAT